MSGSCGMKARACARCVAAALCRACASRSDAAEPAPGPRRRRRRAAGCRRSSRRSCVLPAPLSPTRPRTSPGCDAEADTDRSKPLAGVLRSATLKIADLEIGAAHCSTGSKRSFKPFAELAEGEHGEEEHDQREDQHPPGIMDDACGLRRSCRPRSGRRSRSTGSRRRGSPRR